MCGIFGANYKTIEDTERARKSMEYRGPDFQKTIKFNNFHFAHNRLSIQDLSDKSNQPYLYKDCALVYNGELWNKQTLKYFNNEFETSGDVEKFTKALYDLGPTCLKDMSGMFAFAFLKDNKLIIGRDHIGEIPIYYYHNKNKFVFSSEIKAIKEFDSSILTKEIKLLPPGSYASFENDILEITKYYSIPNEIINDSKETIITNLKDMIWLAVETKIPKEVPYTVLLSGGIDSSIIAYILKQFNPDLEAFTVSLNGDGKKKNNNDLYFAREMAKFLNIKLNEIVLTEDDVFNNINNTIETIEDKSWTQVSSGLPHIAMAKEIAKHGYKVVFSGSGSDELFASYPTERRWSYYDDKYNEARHNLINKIHKSNVIRENKCMMKYSQEIRSPFLERNFVEYAINIPVEFRLENKRMKPLLRYAFQGLIPDELLWREKVCEGEGVGIESLIHSQKDNIIKHYKEFFK